MAGKVIQHLVRKKRMTGACHSALRQPIDTPRLTGLQGCGEWLDVSQHCLCPDNLRSSYDDGNEKRSKIRYLGYGFRGVAGGGGCVRV